MRATVAVCIAVVLAASGCTAAPADGDAPTAPPTEGGTPPSGGAEVDRAFAEQVRDRLVLPALPSFTVPTGLLTSAEARDASAALDVPPGLYDDIAVLDARCDATGEMTAADRGKRLEGPQGAAHYDGGTTSITVAGDGTGVYDAPGLHIAVLPGGAGVYDDGATRLTVDGDGGGTYSDHERRLTVRADGSGSYQDDRTRLWIGQDGSAGYEDDRLRVSVDGNGDVFGEGEPARVAAVREVLEDGLPTFPPVPAITTVEQSGTACGTVIRLDANVLFDFDSAHLQPEARGLVTRVAELLVALGSPTASVNGHTDGVGEERYNLALSQDRAEAVRKLLVSAGVQPASLTVIGRGESQPLRSETTKAGMDDPAARQLNRRVEVVLAAG